MATRKIKTDQQYTRAAIQENSFNKEKRTLDVVFASETPAPMYNWDIGAYDEVLVCNPKNIRMERAKAGLPVFDSHYPRTAMVQLGRADNIRFENGQAIATITLGARADEAFISDVENGIISGISVGYRVFEYDGKIEKDKRPLLRATDWEILEISFAPVQADPKSRIRSEASETSINTIINFNSDMKKTIAEIRAIATDEQKARLDAIISMTRGANLSDEQVIELYEGEKTVEQIRSEYTKPQDNTKPVNVEEIRQQADAATKARLDAILKSTRAAKQEDSFAIELFNSNKTIEECRQAIIEKFVKGDPQINSHVNMGADQADKVRAAMEGALGHRVGVVTELKPEFREFRGMSLLRMAEEFLMQSGVKTGGMSRREIAELALGLKQNRAMSTSDFPLILGNTVNRRLLGAYQLQPRTFMPFCSKGNASDFREMSRLKLSGMMDSFEEVKEGGEYKNSSFKESQEKYTVAKYGRKIMITWETLINDDLSAFDRIPAAIAAKAAQKQSDIVWAIITANKAMADGTALFHADHGNLAAAGAAITIASLSAARAAMRKMKGMEGDYINVIPEFLLVGPDKELEAYQFTSANYVPVSNATINPEFNRNLKPIVEPRLTGNQWYLSANPSLVDTIEYAFLDGEGELFTEQRVGFDVDGLEIKARMVFGAKAIDHRGLYKNPGA